MCIRDSYSSSLTIAILSTSISNYNSLQPLHCPIQIFHCWKQHYRSFSNNFFLTSMALSSLYLWTQNRFLLMHLTFGNKKGGVAWGKVQRVWWMHQHGNSMFAKNILMGSAFYAGALPWWRIHTPLFHRSGLFFYLLMNRSQDFFKID